MSEARLSTQSEQLEKTNLSRPKRAALALGAAGAAGALVASGALVEQHNNAEATRVHAAAVELATNRNTCNIRSLVATTELGKQAIIVTIGLKTKSRPQSIDTRYDGFGMDTTFKDESGNMVSGIVVVNTASQSDAPNDEVLASSEGDGPDTGTNSATISGIFSSKRSVYKVFRQNAIDTSVEGPLVANKYDLVAGLVPCGSFVYTPSPKPTLE